MSIIGPDCEAMLLTMVQEIEFTEKRAAAVKKELALYTPPRKSLLAQYSLRLKKINQARRREDRIIFISHLLRFLIENATAVCSTQEALAQFRVAFITKCDNEFSADLGEELMNYYKWKFPRNMGI